MLREILQDADLHQEVCLFLEEMLGRYPDEYIRLLPAAARRRERTERGVGGAHEGYAGACLELERTWKGERSMNHRS